MFRLQTKLLDWIFAAFVVFALAEYHFQLLLPLENGLSDLFVRLQAVKVQPDSDIVLVDIDDRSLERMSELADRWHAMTRKRVSFVDLYEDFNREKRLRDPNEFNDKVVVVGTAATGLHDLRVTPISEFHSGAKHATQGDIRL